MNRTLFSIWEGTLKLQKLYRSLTIREFIEFYQRKNIDKIFLYDNNDLKGEHFEEVISGYINIGFVQLINFRGFESPQLNAYNHCYKKHNKVYDWFRWIYSSRRFW